MAAADTQVIRTLVAHPVLAGWPRPALARLVACMEHRSVGAGTRVAKEGDEGDHVYIVLSGELRHGDDPVRELAGADLVVGADEWQADVVAETAAELAAIPTARFRALQPIAQRDALIRRLSGRPDRAPPAASHAARGDGRVEAIGWALALVVPGLVHLACAQIPWSDMAGGDVVDARGVQHFLVAFSATVVMWVFQLVPPYVAGLLPVLVCLVLGVGERNVVLSGFSSSSFFMAMSIFGLGAVLAGSGIAYRGLLLLLRRVPANAFGLDVGVFVTGLALTPLLPTANGRTSLLTPLVPDLLQVGGMKPQGRGAARIVALLFTGTTVFSASFLTSKSLNILLYGLLTPQRQDEFTWLLWLRAAGVFTLVTIAGIWILTLFLHRGAAARPLDRGRLAWQLEALGPLRPEEWTALIGVTLFAVAVLTSTTHMIKPAWIALAVFFGFLSLGVLDKRGVKERIDWTFLILLGSMIGIVHVMDDIGLSAVLQGELSSLGTWMESGPMLFFGVVVAVVFALRLFLPINAAGVLAGTVFIPWAEAHGINGWVVALVVLASAECWLLPYQASYAVLFEDLVDPGCYQRRDFLRFNLATVILRLVAIAVSLLVFDAWGLV